MVETGVDLNGHFTEITLIVDVICADIFKSISHNELAHTIDKH